MFPGNAPPPITEPQPNFTPWWAPRFWIGSDLAGWLRLLARNRFRVDLPHLHMAWACTMYGLGNTGLRGLQNAIYGSRISRLNITEAPIFIIGHWRCGTTLLHELLILDERHSFPNTWQCFSPNHFLLTERVGKRWLKFVLPKQRPMDNMPLDWNYPQEDEFALCNLGVPTPYASILFPNEPPQFPEYLDLEGLSPSALKLWKDTFLKFIKQVTFATPRRIVLKSPPHTARIKVLLELFPDARFVHITRDPYVVFPSTMHLWKSLYATQGMQTPNYAGLSEYVFETFNRMHFKYQETRDLLAPNRLFETRYEDLLADPSGQMQALYEQLQLGDYEPARAKVEQYFADKKSYKTNRYPLPDNLQAEITRRWSDYIGRYGYADQSTTA